MIMFHAQLYIFTFLCIGIVKGQSRIPERNSRALNSESHELLTSSDLSKIDDLQSSDTIPPLFIQAPLPPSHPWWNSADNSGWYGFNHFIPRSARNLPAGVNRQARNAFLLGESTQSFPFASFHPGPPHPPPFIDPHTYHQLREIQRNLRPLPQVVAPHIIMIDQAMSFPPGILVPVVRPQQQQQHSFAPRQQSSYGSPGSKNGGIRRLATSPTPVTIKVVPLKLTSMDIANALKTMSWVPIPVDFLNFKVGNKNMDDDNAPTYKDKRYPSFMKDESDLPRPSSHVATPMNKPLGITYADSQRTEHYVHQYKPRK